MKLYDEALIQVKGGSLKRIIMNGLLFVGRVIRIRYLVNKIFI